MTLPDTPSRTALDRYHSAIFENQRTWVRRIGAVDVAGQPCPRFNVGDLSAVRTGATGAIMLPDPPEDAITVLPGAFTWLQQAGSGDVLIWAAAPHREMDRWLSAHGARESFVPSWMIRPAQQALSPCDPDQPTTVRTATPDDLPLLLNAPDIPYFSQWQARATLHLAEESPDVVVMLALVRGRVVGRAVMNVCDSAVGCTAGIYDVGISPRWQRQGIGRAMMHALIDVARDRDADFLTLNATPAGQPLYRSLAFEDVGEGQTWLLPAATLRTPPSDELTQFAMAISGDGDLREMGELARQHLPNGDTPLAHAARFEQPGAARQLVALGTVADIAALWQLGLRDEAKALMRDREALDALRGQQGTTPIHTAIYWNDLDFLALLLDAGADPHVRDTTFDGDGWGWCHALNNHEALVILNDYARKR